MKDVNSVYLSEIIIPSGETYACGTETNVKKILQEIVFMCTHCKNSPYFYGRSP